MAVARGRRTNRVTIHTRRQTAVADVFSYVPTYRMGRVEAEALRKTGELGTSNGIYYWSNDQRQSPLSPVNLTSADMHGVVERRRRALERVQNWDKEFNRRSLTIIAGRGAWVPGLPKDAEALKALGVKSEAERVELCSRLQEQASRAKRYANAARN